MDSSTTLCHTYSLMFKISVCRLWWKIMTTAILFILVRNTRVEHSINKNNHKLFSSLFSFSPSSSIYLLVIKYNNSKYIQANKCGLRSGSDVFVLYSIQYENEMHFTNCMLFLIKARNEPMNNGWLIAFLLAVDKDGAKNQSRRLSSFDAPKLRFLCYFSTFALIILFTTQSALCFRSVIGWMIVCVWPWFYSFSSHTVIHIPYFAVLYFNFPYYIHFPIKLPA